MVQTRTVQVHPADRDQLAAWDGPEGDYRRAPRTTVESHTGPDGVTLGSAAWLVTTRAGE